MSEMIKRAARAAREEIIRQYRDDERRKCPGGAAFYEENVSPYQIARAVLQAIREPSEAAILAGARAGVDQIYYKSNAWERSVAEEFQGDYLNYAKFAWRAMIDTALSE